MADERTCPECGKPLGADLLEGLCPECMLEVGVGTASVPTVELTDAQPGTESWATPPVFLPEGSTFGPYRIRRHLGHGGMGVVYEADEIESGRRVALKIIRERLDSPQDRARFLREGRLAASINHPNCVYVFGTEEIQGIPAIAMEFVSGGTLERRLRHEGPQPIARTVDAVLQVIAGLEAAQARGILHRDIKPSNCFEDDQGNVKVGDFGLSISTAPRAETMITEAGSMIGTPAYCSPERDGTTPGHLALDQVWITEDGRAKLFDAPVPGLAEDEVPLHGAGPAPESAERARRFLDEVAAFALAGASAPPLAAVLVARPLPIHARKSLEKLSTLQGPAPIEEAIRPLLRRNAEVTRLRRAVALVACMLIAVIGTVGLFIGLHFSQRWQREHPELMKAQAVLSLWQEHRTPLTPKQHLPTEEEIGIYIATHLDKVITDPVWQSGIARSVISHGAREFAEASVTNHAGASPEAKAQAEEKIKPMLEARSWSTSRVGPDLLLFLGLVIQLAYTTIPAILAAVITRGGLILLATGITFVRRDGRRASRLRLLWRALVTWSPTLVTLAVFVMSVDGKTPVPPILAASCACLLAVGSLSLPVRGIQDRLAGTWPVPR